jgi:hypothetical protein
MSTSDGMLAGVGRPSRGACVTGVPWLPCCRVAEDCLRPPLSGEYLIWYLSVFITVAIGSVRIIEKG